MPLKGAKFISYLFNAKGKRKKITKYGIGNFQLYHREFSIVLSITFIRIQYLIGPEKGEFLSDEN